MAADHSTSPEQPGPQDDVRRKFREALERKQGRARDAAPGPDDAAAGPSARAGTARTQRMFRRKSG